MDLYQTLLDLKDFSSLNNNVFLLSEGVHNNSIFKNETDQDIDRCIREINLKFNSAKRTEAIHLLLLLLPQSSNEILKREGERWLKMSFNCLTSDNSRLKSAACYLLLYILRTSECISSLKSEIGRAVRENHSADTLMKLINADRQWRKASYELLYYYLKLFPGVSLPQTCQLEKEMLSFLTLPPCPKEDEGIFQAGKVYSALKGAEIKKLISYGHCSLDVLLESVVETEEYSIDRKHTLPLHTLDNVIEIGDQIRKIFMASSLLCNTMTFIEAFLENYPGGKVCVCPRDLLNLPLRLLQVDQKSVSKLKGQEHSHLAAILPSLHQRALKFLRNIFFSVGDSLDLFYGVLFDEIASVLNSSKTQINKYTKGAKKIIQQSDTTRNCAYKTLQTLVEISGGIYDMPLEIAESIVSDIIPYKEGVSLRSIRGGSISKVTIHRKSKKRIYAANASDTTKCEDILPCRTSNGANVRAALELAAKWIEVGHHSMSMRPFELLSKCLQSMVPLLPVGAYTIPEVRHTYYETLVSLSLYPHPACPQSYSTLSHAFSVGRAEIDERVSSICQRGLGIVSFVLSNPQVSIFQDHVAQTRAEKEQEEEESKSVEDEEFEILVSSENESEDEIEEIVNGNEVMTEQEEEEKIEEERDFPNMLIDLSEDENVVGAQEEICLSSDEEQPVEISSVEKSPVEVVNGEIEKEESNKRKQEEPETPVIEKNKRKKKSAISATRKSPRKKTSQNEESADVSELEKAPDVLDENLEEMLATFVDADPDPDSDS